MTTLSRRSLLGAGGALTLATVLAACADTGADGQAVSSNSQDADYDAVINSGPVAGDEAVAASTWASAIKQAGVFKTGGTKTSQIFSLEDPASGPRPAKRPRCRIRRPPVRAGAQAPRSRRR